MPADSILQEGFRIKRLNKFLEAKALDSDDWHFSGNQIDSLTDFDGNIWTDSRTNGQTVIETDMMPVIHSYIATRCFGLERNYASAYLARFARRIYNVGANSDKGKYQGARDRYSYYFKSHRHYLAHVITFIAVEQSLPATTKVLDFDHLTAGRGYVLVL